MTSKKKRRKRRNFTAAPTTEKYSAKRSKFLCSFLLLYKHINIPCSTLKIPFQTIIWNSQPIPSNNENYNKNSIFSAFPTSFQKQKHSWAKVSCQRLFKNKMDFHLPFHLLLYTTLNKKYDIFFFPKQDKFILLKCCAWTSY